MGDYERQLEIQGNVQHALLGFIQRQREHRQLQNRGVFTGYEQYCFQVRLQA
jgi:hypothetical protein